MLGCHTKFPGRSFTGMPPAPTQECLDLAECLRGHVEMLATTIGERNVYHPDQLAVAAEYIERTFIMIGYEPVPLPLSLAPTVPRTES